MSFKIIKTNHDDERRQITDALNGIITTTPHDGDFIRDVDEGEGTKIGDASASDFGWRDILGQIRQRGVGANDPTWSAISGSVFSGWSFALNDEIWVEFHIPHDYAAGIEDIHFHSHWLSDGTDVNTVKWEWSFVYADGFGGGNFDFASPTTATAEEAASGTAHDHYVTESTAQTISGIEVDGMIYARCRRITNGGTDNTDNIFLITTDVHYQSTNLPTKNKAPDFYT